MSSMSSTSINDECAIDDDDDGLACQEDFVPSSLNDLLTPQERERRGSRPSSAATPVSFAVPPQQTSIPSGSAIPNNDIWASSPRFATRRRDDSFSEIAGSPLRQSFSVTNSITSNLQVPQHSYHPPIGTPERTSSSSFAFKQFSAIGTPAATGSPSLHALTGAGLSNVPAASLPPSADSALQGTQSLFDDDINIPAHAEANDNDFETQFHMDDEIDLDTAAQPKMPTNTTPSTNGGDLHLVGEDVANPRRELYENMGSLVR